ncbi:MAG TPA: DUF4142 domain-containing protein [Kofleriaceae bacterium]|nr:DUF4142 domain-containing protein [Kofleriaceae bacterium]
MQIKALARWAALAACLAAPLVVAADTAKTEKPAKLTDAELEVLAQIHQVNLMEIDAGRLATRTSPNAAVKEYGTMLIADHTAADKDIMAFAKQHGQSIPRNVSEATDKKEVQDNKDEMSHLKSLKGSAFDSEFLKFMVEGHENEIAKVDTAMQNNPDTDFQSELDKIKPTLQKHADKARDLEKSTATSMR